MGNCQAAELAAATVECPDGRVERVSDLAMPAQRFMSYYPGHFVALMSSSIVPAGNPTRFPAHHGGNYTSSTNNFKLLPADAPLRLGNRYRLISFEDVLTYYSQGATQGKMSKPTRLSSIPSKKANNNKDYFRLGGHYNLNNTSVVRTTY